MPFLGKHGKRLRKKPFSFAAEKIGSSPDLLRTPVFEQQQVHSIRQVDAHEDELIAAPHARREKNIGVQSLERTDIRRLQKTLVNQGLEGDGFGYG
jgi:low affinity Fe/Cu permease